MRTSQSFSIIELLLVCAIIAIGAALYAPRLNFVQQYKLERELDAFEALFEHLRNRAMATGVLQRLMFLFDKDMYCYGSVESMQSTGKLCAGVQYGFLSGTLGPPGNPVQLLMSASSFGEGKPQSYVDFFPNGKISPGALYLRGREMSVGAALTCAISQVSYIRKYVYINQQWQRINDR